jgi:hypothetical protein
MIFCEGRTIYELCDFLFVEKKMSFKYFSITLFYSCYLLRLSGGLELYVNKNGNL